MILDVRQRNEYHAGQIQGALNIGLGELQEHLDGLPREIPVVTVCAAGMPAILERSILNRDGRENVRVLDSGGTEDWLPPGTSKPNPTPPIQVRAPGVDRLQWLMRHQLYGDKNQPPGDKPADMGKEGHVDLG